MKPILFIDFDKTLCFDKLWKDLEAEAFAKIQVFMFGQNKDILHKWMRGSYTSEEVNRLVANEIGYEYDRLWEIFVEGSKNLRVSRDTLRSINELGWKYKTILLSDNMDSLTRFTVPALKLDEYFDLVVNSADTGLFKDDNNGEIFLRLIKEHEAKMGECVLIDNSQRSCGCFAELGGKVCLVTPENTIDHWLRKI